MDGRKSINSSSLLLPDLLHQYSDFGGRHLRVAANNNWPFLGLTLLNEETGEAAPDSGIDISIMDALTSTLNFSYVIHCFSSVMAGLYNA